MMLWRKLAALAVALAMSPVAVAQEVDINLDETLTLEAVEVPFKLDITLSAVGPTRIGVEALLDLRELQQRLPTLFQGQKVVDGCANDTTVQTLSALAKDDDLSLSGRFKTEIFACENLGGGNFKRGESKLVLDLDFTATGTVDLASNCVTLELVDLRINPLNDTPDWRDGNENLETARDLIISGVGLILAENPICPELPPKLTALSPTYSEAGPREIGDGGVGVYLDGEVEITPQTLLDLLNVLQADGVLPARP